MIESTKYNPNIKFDDIKFQPSTHHIGVHAVVELDNGYKASIVCHEYSYGGDRGLYELAVIRDNRIVYDTPITNDVLGWLTPDDIVNTLNKINLLKGQ